MEPDVMKKQIKAEADLEVTGVSQRGRVRKKSSKLMDFESPDDIESVRRGRVPAAAGRRPLVEHQATPSMHNQHHYSDHNMEQPDSMDSMESDDDDLSDPEELHMAGVGGGEEPAEGQEGALGTYSRPAHSLYMMEKSSKKKMVVRDGRVVGRAKAQRKDKGKTRVTAYMMWAKEARAGLISKYPDMDFSSIAKRLGEMWSNVNQLERYLWKKKAKKFAAKKAEPPPAKATPASNSAIKTQPSANQNNAMVTPPSQNSRNRHPAHPKPPHTNNSGGSAGTGMYRVVGVGPAEVGAHLRLLGESLAIIGERLKEHEGQIAVSGSVSVLLDTLLCSLAPLVCLTAHVPGISPPLPLLQDTLDNIAYIMPGL